MTNIFSKELTVISNAEELISSNQFKSVEDKMHYANLLNEYKDLLRQMVKVVKISDITQLELKTLSDNLEVISQIDVLTGLYNRRYFNEVYDREWKSAVRLKVPISLIMIDIDYFKKYNDTYGHLQGDECLAAIAKEIKKSTMRPRDVVSRFGGEEFIMMLPETALDGAIFLAEALLNSVENLNIEHQNSPIADRITLSIGLASLVPNKDDNIDTLLKMADDALYEAKNDGRDCFRVYNSPKEHT